MLQYFIPRGSHFLLHRKCFMLHHRWTTKRAFRTAHTENMPTLFPPTKLCRLGNNVKKISNKKYNTHCDIMFRQIWIVSDTERKNKRRKKITLVLFVKSNLWKWTRRYHFPFRRKCSFGLLSRFYCFSLFFFIFLALTEAIKFNGLFRYRFWPLRINATYILYDPNTRI